MDLDSLRIDTLSVGSTPASGVTSPPSSTPLGGEARSATDISKDSESIIYHNSKAYKRGGALPAKKRSRMGWIWTVGEEVYDGEKKYYWLCSSCLEEDSFRTFAPSIKSIS